MLPGGESTAMGLIGTHTTNGGSSNNNNKTMWQCLQEFSKTKPTWGTCAGMILLAEKCIGTSAVIQDGQALIGGMDITVCRNYFGSQVSSFEMSIPPPPTLSSKQPPQQPAVDDSTTTSAPKPFPGVFIRAPAILSVGPEVDILGTVVATPCHQAAVVLQELDKRIQAGENVVQMGVVDSLERDQERGSIQYKQVVVVSSTDEDKESNTNSSSNNNNNSVIRLPGAANGTNARKVICAVKRDNLLCTAFHPELTNDLRWHEYFVSEMVKTQLGSEVQEQ